MVYDITRSFNSAVPAEDQLRQLSLRPENQPFPAAQHTGRTVSSIISMARRLGRNGKQLHWTDEDKAVLITHYAAGADKTSVMTMLPGRTLPGIMSMVYVLGIVRRRWQPEESRILAKYYATEGTRVAERLPGRTVSAVANQAYALKLRHPRGMRWDEHELALLAQNQHLPWQSWRHFFPEGVAWLSGMPV